MNINVRYALRKIAIFKTAGVLGSFASKILVVKVLNSIP